MSDTFDHEADAWDSLNDEDDERSWGGQRRITRCNRYGSTSVRWRQQGGKWVLFSLQPGVVHTCQIDPSEFRPIKD
jgi:hypothetical protein